MKKIKTAGLILAILLTANTVPMSVLAAETPEETTAETTETQPVETQETEPVNEGVRNFVARIYTTALERDYDEEGLLYWCGELQGNRTTGLDIFKRITDCPEFTDKNLTDEQYLNVLYKTFFDRDPDVEGLVYWLDAMLNQDLTRTFVLECFADSNEWVGICEGFGILPGNTPKQDVPTEPQAPVATEGAINFVKRLYSNCMGREADEDGLKYWTDLLATKQIGGRDAAFGFFSSEEFMGRAGQMEKTDLIKVFYTVFLDRTPSDQEVNEWAELIKMGNEVATLYNGFSGSYEFADICMACDIAIGDYKPMQVIQNDPNFNSYLEMNMQEGINNLSNAVLVPKRTYKFVNIQSGTRVYEEREIPAADIQAIEAFAAAHFEPTWSPAQKAAFTLYWIHNNMDYDFRGNRTADTFAVSAFVNQAGQCAQYNGALVEMMCYLGFDACLVQGYRMQVGGNYQHFWGEVYVNGQTFVLEAGNTKDGNWFYFAVPYSKTRKYVTVD